MALDAAIQNLNAFSPKPLGLLLTVAGGQAPIGVDHSPPGKPDAGGQHVAYRSRSSRVAGSPGKLAVADDFATVQVSNDPANRLHE